MNKVAAHVVGSMIVTEKSNHMLQDRKIITMFAASCSVTKSQVKYIIEKNFPSVKIAKVRTMMLSPKVKLFKGKKGVRVKKKKIMISFKECNMCDIILEV